MEKTLPEVIGERCRGLDGDLPTYLDMVLSVDDFLRQSERLHAAVKTVEQITQRVTVPINCPSRCR